MTKNEFINALGLQLKNLPEEDRREILYDYQEHFQAGQEAGKSEEEIAAKLGDPKAIARSYIADYAVKRAESDTTPGNVFRAVFAALGLGFFNLVFILGPFMGLVGVLMGLFGAALGITVGGVGLLGGTVLSSVLPGSVFHLPPGINHLALFFAGLGLVCLGLLALIGLSYLAKYLALGTLKYLKMNIKIITKSEV